MKTVLKFILGVVLILAGIAFGLYVGLFVLFIGGISQIVDQINADKAEGAAVAWGVIKILCASGVGGLAFYALALPGFALLGWGGTDAALKKL